ncbi:hypothetical protein [Paraburkholderia caribensis]|uniref:hypothetical protein n=1 Tax=Paraburkholderia caribensis TaxID=75105 RepID=UPI001CAB648D|nr:hypothetical protein [Paraburkholderia caribensis]CAG9249541.1 conserved hypothetical protein [Paraburkholderia caribensis]
MNDLLSLMLESHGGFARWNQFRTVDAIVSIGGALWERKGWMEGMTRAHVTAELHAQHVSYSPFSSEGIRSLYNPSLVRLETTEGKLIIERSLPRKAFDAHTIETPWDRLHLAYFSGYAMWNYLTTPFICVADGVETEEIEPWTDQGVLRRRLKVTFPDHIATHCAEQTFHVDSNGLIARQDYQALVTGGGLIAHYLTDYVDVDGIRLPSTRRAYRRSADGVAHFQHLLVGIDFHEIVLR